MYSSQLCTKVSVLIVYQLHNTMIIYPVNETKYYGSIIKTKKKVQFIIYVNKKRVLLKENKFTDFDTHKEAIDDISVFRRKWSIDNNKVVNSSTTIDNKYLSIDVGDGKKMITDMCDKELVDKYHWRLHNGGCYVSRLLPMDERTNKKREYRYFHEDKISIKLVNHVNNNKLDNRAENLIDITNKKLAWKNQHCNKKMRIDNTSGITGVYRGCFKGYDYWEVKGVDYNNNKIQKKYGVRKWGEEAAKKLAHAFRNKLIEESYKE